MNPGALLKDPGILSNHPGALLKDPGVLSDARKRLPEPSRRTCCLRPHEPSRVEPKNPGVLLQGPRDPFKGTPGPFKGRRGPFKRTPGSFSRAPGDLLTRGPRGQRRTSGRLFLTKLLMLSTPYMDMVEITHWTRVKLYDSHAVREGIVSRARPPRPHSEPRLYEQLAVSSHTTL